MISVTHFHESENMTAFGMKYTPVYSDNTDEFCCLFPTKKEAVLYWVYSVRLDLLITAENHHHHIKEIHPYYFKQQNLLDDKCVNWCSHYWKYLQEFESLDFFGKESYTAFCEHYTRLLKHMKGTIPLLMNHNYSHSLKRYGTAFKMLKQLVGILQKYKNEL